MSAGEKIEMDGVRSAIEYARQGYGQLLQRAMRNGAITIEQYVRYLSMQYHLTKDVQEYFYYAAAHRSLRRRPDLRRFLVDFANEEESHYLLAQRDLETLGKELLPPPFDVELWHAYYRGVVRDRPFLRLGATCILENISGGTGAALAKQALQAPFLNASNTRFLRLHLHEDQPHGAEILEVLRAASLTADEQRDLEAGAWRGGILYLRMTRWAVDPEFPEVP